MSQLAARSIGDAHTSCVLLLALRCSSRTCHAAHLTRRPRRARRAARAAAAGARDGSRRETVLRRQGPRGRAKNCFRIAIRRVEKSLQHAYRGAPDQRNARRTWIVQLGAATQEHGIRYSQFIHGLKQAEVGVNRKILAQLAQQEPYTFRAIADEAKGARARGWAVGDTGAWFLPRNRARARQRRGGPAAAPAGGRVRARRPLLDRARDARSPEERMQQLQEMAQARGPEFAQSERDARENFPYVPGRVARAVGGVLVRVGGVGASSVGQRTAAWSRASSSFMPAWLCAEAGTSPP